MMENNQKVILLDFGHFQYSAIFAAQNTNGIPPTYIALKSMLTNLRNIEVNKNDIIIVAVDSKEKSWRKELEEAYKADRKEKRQKHDINWDKLYDKFKELVVDLDISTPFHFIKGYRLEADDIIAGAIQYFNDKKCIIMSIDSDFEMLFEYNNVDIYSPRSKKYKRRRKNPKKILSEKIQKERSDNLITDIETDAQFAKRKMIVDLISLPKVIKKRVYKLFDSIDLEKDYYLEEFPYRKLKSYFKEIYNNDKITTYKKSMTKELHKNRKQRNNNGKQTSLL